MMKASYIAALSAVLTVWSPSAFAQRAGAGDGLDGATFCIAAGEYLIARGAGTPAIEADTAGWRKVLGVIEASEAGREAALSRSRASFTDLDAGKTPLGGMAAKAAVATCAGEGNRAKYVAHWGSPALVEAAQRGGE